VDLVRKVGWRGFEGQDDCRGLLLKYVDIDETYFATLS
jgi:hypothetical protein